MITRRKPLNLLYASDSMQLGRSTEDIQNKVQSSEDEFENSVDEILENEDAEESDRDLTDQEVGIIEPCCEACLRVSDQV